MLYVYLFTLMYNYTVQEVGIKLFCCIELALEVQERACNRSMYKNIFHLID